MRSRSSRLFIVLLHLVGISTNLPEKPPLFQNAGIVGVNTMAILLEPLELRVAGGLDQFLYVLDRAGYDVDDTFLNEPYWLQDESDGMCLGPDGFSDCGDATLWLLRRRPATKRRRRKGKKNNQELGINDENQQDLEWQYALELIDINSLRSSDDTTELIDLDESIPTNSERPTANAKSKSRSNDIDNGDCMVVASSLIQPTRRQRRRGKQRTGNNDGFNNDQETIPDGHLSVGECQSDHAWSWRINENGFLTWEGLEGIKSNLQKQYNTRQAILGGPATRLYDVAIGKGMDQDSTKSGTEITGTKSTPDCVWRTNDTIAITSSCTEDHSREPVRFTVIKYQTSSTLPPQLPHFTAMVSDTNESSISVTTTGASSTSSIETVQEEEGEDLTHIPRSKRTSQDHASAPIMFPDLKQPSGLLFAGSSAAGLSPSNTIQHGKEKRNDMASSPFLGVGGYIEPTARPSISVTNRRKEESGNLLHHPPASSLHHGIGGLPVHHHDDTPHRPRKIPVHPYIDASKDGIFVEPLTELPFHTDISGYLGHDRKETGRHTLTGLGLYVKTMLKIKIYAVALYVPKRDVLADPGFAPFAAMDVEGLRNSDQFYQHLMQMGTSPDHGYFDRTIFIKLNLQLSTDTMRSSLEADWKFLTPEHKKMIINTSFEERQADDRMLRTIQDEENTSRCSCGQVAPEEYEADPSCCARGTELVFTWRKNGGLELRLDGRLLEIFSSPGMGKGIFFEYLRGDDPISFDARDHFVDGFPFLLAPLAQVKGISSPVQKPEFTETIKSEERVGAIKYFSNFISQGVEFMDTRSSEVSSWIEGNVNKTITNVANTFHAISSNTQNVRPTLERRREEVWHQIVSASENSSRFLSNRIPRMKRGKESMTSDGNISLMENDNDILDILSEIPKGPISDEIGVIIEAKMNFTHQLFLYMVHFYLLLLLIVSVPDSYTTRLVVKRSSSVDSDSDNEESCKNDNGHVGTKKIWDPSIRWCGVPGIDRRESIRTEATYEEDDSSHQEGPIDCTNDDTLVRQDDGIKRVKIKKSLSYYL